MSFGLLPAAVTRVGDSMRVGMAEEPRGTGDALQGVRGSLGGE
jgi:hypothetical protein